jgi:hypothetical protein
MKRISENSIIMIEKRFECTSNEFDKNHCVTTSYNTMKRRNSDEFTLNGKIPKLYDHTINNNYEGTTEKNDI